MIEQLTAPAFHKPLNFSYKLLTKADGRIPVTVRANARRFTLSSRNGIVRMSAPPGHTYVEAYKAYERMRAKMDIKPAPTYTEGQLISYPEGVFALLRESQREKIREMTGRDIPVVILPEKFNLQNPKNNAAVTRSLMRLAAPRARKLLLPRAMELARMLGVKPCGWRVGTGLTTLGTCSGRGIINLSAACLFLTPELRDYIICHEFAHLTEMNHSERFHRLCDSYLEGRERLLERQLRSFKWPIIR